LDSLIMMVAESTSFLDPEREWNDAHRPVESRPGPVCQAGR